MDKEQKDLIFVILVYRNYVDLEECIESISRNVENYKIIVVNAYYDDCSMQGIEDISKKYNCDFINIENKGYSFGNNVGIKYARDHYDFKHLIVSNPDIIIKEFPNIEGMDCDIIAPQIKTITGKAQNPMHIVENNLAERLIYRGFKKQSKISLYIGLAINKIRREFFLLFGKNKKKRIFSAHGSFVIFSNKALSKLDYMPYDENMFLFAEEMVLAVKAKEQKLKTFYMPNIKIYHKEDGSMKLSDLSINKELAKSNIYFYEEYKLKKGKKDWIPRKGKRYEL